MIYKDVDSNSIAHLLDGDLVLLVTATDIETKYTHLKIEPLVGHKEILRVFEGNHTYYFGVFGNYKVAHVQCSMGSISRDSSIMTVSSALTFLKTTVVIMIGIAFGVEEEIQKIGDVLVAESVIPYNVKRVGESKTISRGIEAQSSQILLNRFKNIIGNWEFFNGDDTKAKMIFTRILSGEELVDNLEYRNKLKLEFPDSKGGEMEGAGLYSACGNKVDWILVKGICDFADGNKKENKKINQKVAIESALSACSEIFNSPFAFQELGVKAINNIIDESCCYSLYIGDVLFEYYDALKENYYIERNSDYIFNQYVRQYGVWIYGPSGCGKSNLIVRNLIKNKIPFIQINLAPCIGSNIEEFFKEILYEIAFYAEGVSTEIQPKSFSECSKCLMAILNKYYSNKELLIFIEEIPINSSEEKKEFCEKIFSLIISKNFIIGLDKVKFVLSSIDNPSLSISEIQQKIYQHLMFIPLTYWGKDEIILLVDKIIGVFNVCLTSDFKSSLIERSKGSPRFIKKFFRSIYTLNKFDDKTYVNILRDIERELN
ncbi:MAG: hypothetical protein HGB23_02870 [Chlorobiaceae bacterium]|nr:hypothetical protein [Chlorobiaceae bacterium]